MDEIRIALVDDHAVVRQGLRAMIDREPDLRVVGEASSAQQATAMLDLVRPTVVLLDLKLTAGSECDGLPLCATITQRYPGSRVLVLTSSADEWLILESIKQGRERVRAEGRGPDRTAPGDQGGQPRGERLRPAQRRGRGPVDAREPASRRDR